jgi:hypothetical protein
MEHKNRNKTLRKPSSSKKITSVFSIEEGEKHTPISIEETRSTLDPGFFSFLKAESISALKKPWLRLERGMRIQKFRQFASEYVDEYGKKLEEKERDILFKTLVSSNDLKLLNSKQSVVYDLDEGKIKDIKGLKLIKEDDGSIVFKIEGSRPTKRAKHIESKIEHS